MRKDRPLVICVVGAMLFFGFVAAYDGAAPHRRVGIAVCMIAVAVLAYWLGIMFSSGKDKTSREIIALLTVRSRVLRLRMDAANTLEEYKEFLPKAKELRIQIAAFGAFLTNADDREQAEKLLAYWYGRMCAADCDSGHEALRLNPALRL